MKNQSATDFLERTDRLAVALDVALRKLPEMVGISEAMFWAYRSGKHRVTDKAWKKLKAAEIVAGLRPSEQETPINQSVSEHRAPYLLKGSSLPSGVEHSTSRVAGSSLNLNPAFRPPPEQPTPQSCLQYFTEYLREIADVPGGIGHVWIQLQEHFSMEKARRLRAALEE